MTDQAERTNTKATPDASGSAVAALLACGSILPHIVTETGEEDEPIQEAVVCDSISGGAQYENDMPKRLSLIRMLADGTEYRAEYVQAPPQSEMPTSSQQGD